MSLRVVEDNKLVVSMVPKDHKSVASMKTKHNRVIWLHSHKSFSGIRARVMKGEALALIDHEGFGFKWKREKTNNKPLLNGGQQQSPNRILDKPRPRETLKPIIGIFWGSIMRGEWKGWWLDMHRGGRPKWSVGKFSSRIEGRARVLIVFNLTAAAVATAVLYCFSPRAKGGCESFI